MSSSGINGTFNRFRIVLDSDLLGERIAADPVNITDDVLEFKRSNDLHGVFKSISDGMEYVRTPVPDAVSVMQYVKEVYDAEGVNAEIKITKQIRNDKTDIWENEFSSFIDMTSLVFTKDKMKAQLTESRFYNDIKSREDEEFELDRTEDVFGNPIDPMPTNQAFIEDRVILVTALLETIDTDNEVIIDNSNNSGSEPKYKTAGVPMDKKFSGNPSIQSTFGNVMVNVGSSGTTNIMFYAVSDKDRTITLDIDIFAKAQILNVDDTSSERIELRLTKYMNNENYDIKETEVLQSFNGLTNTSIVNKFNYQATREIDLLKGESLSLQFLAGAEVGGFLKDGRYDVRFFDILSRIDYRESDTIEPSISDVYLPHEIAERLVCIMTGKKNAFYSKLFGRVDLGYEQDGEFAYLATTNGLKIREVPDSRVSISLEDFFESYNVVTPLAMFIETVNGKERVRIDDINEAYNGNKIIDLGVGDKVETKIDAKKYISKIEIGYEGAGDYEEQQGLDEPNVVNKYSFPIRNTENVLSLISKIRADSFAIAVARRKSFKSKPNEDTRYDDELFFLDLKPQTDSDLLIMRKWDDDFLQVPQGVFSPETAQNLRLSPMNCLFRHGQILRAIGFKNQNDYIRFSSTIGNSGLITFPLNGMTFEEKGNIKISDLDANFFIPEEISFDVSLTNEQRVIIQDNPHSLFRFKDDLGQERTGWLLSTTPKKVTKFVLLSGRSFFT